MAFKLWGKLNEYKKILITIGVSILIVASIFFTGFGIGVHRTNEQWTESYNRLQSDFEAELSGAGDTITELRATVESEGIIISELRDTNERLTDTVGDLKLELNHLRELQSATTDIYIELGNILESDADYIDKIIAIARSLQESISGLETSSN